ncbi:MAG: ATP-binding protein [Spirochaetaceae bacterium]|nr:MAG: ATP-binding protein [Spirochaetaceae bacterium]
MIKRAVADVLQSAAGKGKTIILLGARQTGKTSLLNMLYPASRSDVLYMSGDDADVRRLFETLTAERLRLFLGKKRLLIIDEAQRISDIGLRLKLVTDQLPEIQLIATGSSSFELANRVKEPLTGRKREYHLYPISFGEMVQHHGLLTEKRLIPHRLVFGSYPEVVSNPGDEKNALREISQSYLYKDVLAWEQIQKPEKLERLLQALALQIGSQVSYSELARLCGLDAKTVEKYICVLEQTYIIFRLSSFSRNARNELKNSRKFYFYDNGIRNAVLANFSQIESRHDAGNLWENWLVSERKKLIAARGLWVNSYFWRTKEQKEIDLIEEADGILTAYEFKYSATKKPHCPAAFAKAYPEASYRVINPDNVEDYLLGADGPRP